jgi:hypothetical protein
MATHPLRRPLRTTVHRWESLTSKVGAGLKSVLTGRLKRLPMNLITNEFAFSFAPEGWNYFRALVAEYEQNPHISLERSTFFRFFQHEQVRSVRYLEDLLFLHDGGRRSRDDRFKFYLGTYPWGDHVGGGPWGSYYDRLEQQTTRDLYGYRRNPWYEPADRHPLENEWKHTIQLYSSIRRGYHPLKYGYLPEVTLLVRRNGDIRAVRYNGQHRFSILSHLGRRNVTVLVPSARSISNSLVSWPSTSKLPKVINEGQVVVRESEVEDWYYVKHGYCSREHALEIFHAFFDLNGRERLSHLGLPSVY